MVGFFAPIMHGLKMRIFLQLHNHLQMPTLDVALVPYFLTDLAALAMSRLCSTAHTAELGLFHTTVVMTMMLESDAQVCSVAMYVRVQLSNETVTPYRTISSHCPRQLYGG